MGGFALLHFFAELSLLIILAIATASLALFALSLPLLGQITLDASPAFILILLLILPTARLLLQALERAGGLPQEILIVLLL